MTILDDMKQALEPMFKIADPEVTCYPTLLVNGDHDKGSISICLDNSMVLEADYRNLRYSDVIDMWWVELSNLSMHDDPQAFEDSAEYES